MISESELKKLQEENWRDVGSPECYGYAENLIPGLLDDLLSLWKIARAAQYVCSIRPNPLPDAGIPELKDALRVLEEKGKP